MRYQVRNTLAITAVLVAGVTKPALAQSEIIDGWTDILLAASRLVIIGGGALGIVYSASSMVRAYRAHDDHTRTQHMFAGFFAGVFTIVGVIIGWVSGLLIPGGAG